MHFIPDVCSCKYFLKDENLFTYFKQNKDKLCLKIQTIQSNCFQNFEQRFLLILVIKNLSSIHQARFDSIEIAIVFVLLQY